MSSLLLLLAACGGSTTPSAEAPAAAPAASPNSLTIKGSDSEVNVVQALAEAFMKEHPGVSISVSGGGSGTGIAAIMDGTAQLANSSRALSGTEKIDAGRRGLDLKGFVFATDGLAVVVNEKNAVASLSMDDLGKLYRGETTAWEGLGGAGPVSLYGRQSNSGTYTYFKEAAVKGEYAPTLKQMNGTSQIVEGVRADAGGLGYVAAGYVSGDKVTGLRVVGLVTAPGQAPVLPTDEAAVLSGAYPLARPLYQFLNGAPTGVLKDFLAFEASPAGQSIVKAAGFYTLAPEAVTANAAILGQ